MVQPKDKRPGVFRSLDWVTIVIYLLLLAGGWMSVCGASYDYGDTDLLSLSTRSGMQIVWIATSIVIGCVLLLLDDRYYVYNIAFTAFCDDIQSSYHQGIPIMACLGTASTATGGVCQVCHGVGLGQVHEYV